MGIYMTVLSDTYFGVLAWCDYRTIDWIMGRELMQSCHQCHHRCGLSKSGQGACFVIGTASHSVRRSLARVDARLTVVGDCRAATKRSGDEQKRGGRPPCWKLQCSCNLKQYAGIIIRQIAKNSASLIVFMFSNILTIRGALYTREMFIAKVTGWELKVQSTLSNHTARQNYFPNNL